MSDKPTQATLTDIPVEIPHIKAMATPVVLDQKTQRLAMFTAIAITAGLMIQLAMQILAQFQVARNAVKVEQVKQNLEVTDAKRDVTDKKQDQKLEQIHDLQNSIYGRSLLLNRDYSAEKAERTKNPEDIANAAEQKRLYDEHMKNQAEHDRKLPNRVIEPGKP